MLSSNGSKIFNCFVLVVILVGLAAMIWGKEDDHLRNWIYAWQPLLAGMLAIYAGFITVGQMQKSERGSQRRHEEIVENQMRPARLVIDRVVKHTFNAIGRDVDEFHTACEGYFQSKDWQIKMSMANVAMHSLTRIGNTLKDSELDNAAHLLDGDTLDNWRHLTQLIDGYQPVFEHLKSLNSASEEREKRFKEFQALEMQGYFDFPKQLDSFDHRLANLNRQLARVIKEYEG